MYKQNGFPDTPVYLDGKTEEDKIIYKNENMSSHTHKVHQQSSTTATEVAATQLTKTRVCDIYWKSCDYWKPGVLTRLARTVAVFSFHQSQGVRVVHERILSSKRLRVRNQYRCLVNSYFVNS